MKKIYLFILTGLLFSFPAFADSYLQVSLYDDGEFNVAIDNSVMSSAGNVAEFENLSAGEHYLKVVRVPVNVPPMEIVTFEGTIKIPADYSVYAVIDEYNVFTIYKKVNYAKGRSSLDLNYYKKCSFDKSDNNLNRNNTNNNQNTDCSKKVMSDDNFRSLKRDIGNRNFETSNIVVLKDVLDKNTVSADQVKELLAFFTFESNKLEIAKYAYKNTCDKNNYYKIYDAFTFDSSVEELKNYISGK